jgi:hypothetical protein
MKVVRECILGMCPLMDFGQHVASPSTTRASENDIVGPFDLVADVVFMPMEWQA